jgi:hypothetical protein
MFMGLLDFDTSSLPEPRSKRFLVGGVRATVGAVKGSVQLAQKLHRRVEKIKRAQLFYDAQRRADRAKEERYLRTLELHRHAGLNYHEAGLRLSEFVWGWKDAQLKAGLIDAEMQGRESNLKYLVKDATERIIKKNVLSKVIGKKGKWVE